MNESETRAEHIDPALKAAGWVWSRDGSRPRPRSPLTSRSTAHAPPLHAPPLQRLGDEAAALLMKAFRSASRGAWPEQGFAFQSVATAQHTAMFFAPTESTPIALREFMSILPVNRNHQSSIVNRPQKKSNRILPFGRKLWRSTSSFHPARGLADRQHARPSALLWYSCTEV